MRRSVFSIALVALAIGTVPAAAQFQKAGGYQLLDAVRKSDGDALTRILNMPGSTAVNYRDSSTGDTALSIVIKRQDALYLQFLLQKGADPNLKDGAGMPPIVQAAISNFDSAIPFLVQRRANLDLPDANGQTALIMAVHQRNLGMVRALIAAGADPDRVDTLAGYSARDYAIADKRTPALAKIFAETPKRDRKAVSGPRL